jgi:hypothetical protein
MKDDKEQPHRPLPLKWEFAPDTPTYDFIEDHRLDPSWGLQEAVDNFIYAMEKDEFLAWEAVVAEEQGLSLTKKQEAAIDELFSFDEEHGDRILYINDIPRNSEPWYAILNKIVPHILVEPFRTADVHYEVHCEAWQNLVDCLVEHAGGLSLPPGTSSPVDVVPLELRHKLWLQDCFDALSGLGQDEDLTLENEDQQDRIDWFVGLLAEHKDSVQFFSLTLDSLLERVVLPERDRSIFVKMMQEKLGMQSTTQRIAAYLEGEGLEQAHQRRVSAKERLEQEEQRLLLENERAEQEYQRLLLEEERLKRELREAKEESLRRQVASSQQRPLPQRIGRNDPCPCGSGKKFKRCCIKKYGGN